MRRLEEADEVEGKPASTKFVSLPDLVIVDGGKGQLSSAHEALESLGLGDRPLISLAKRDEEVFMWGRSEPVRMSRRSPALRLLQQLRDEAHRFAITYNRKRRTIRTVTSELMRIPGVGPVRRRQLLQAFGSVQGVRDAEPEAIAKAVGINVKRASHILATLKGESIAPEPPAPPDPPAEGDASPNPPPAAEQFENIFGTPLGNGDGSGH